jgi:hypothetical protein
MAAAVPSRPKQVREATWFALPQCHVEGEAGARQALRAHCSESSRSSGRHQQRQERTAGGGKMSRFITCSVLWAYEELFVV